MKVTLDLDKLLADEQISPEEYERLRELGARGTGRLAFNILVAFGVIAVSGAVLALVPSAVTAIVMGLLVGAGGLALQWLEESGWKLLAAICVVIGALLFGGGMVTLTHGSTEAILLVVVVYALAGVVAQSGLLVVLSVLALSASIGAMTGYFHATYYIGIPEPTLTVVLFSVLTAALRLVSPHLAVAYRRLAAMAMMTAVFVVNFGFWVGSLWGDRFLADEVVIAHWVFSLLWALALIAGAVWAWWRNQRALLNVAVVFGAIHFYTQWFETLGASPTSVLIAGLLALGLAFGLHHLNRRLTQ